MAKIGDTIRIVALAPNADGSHDPAEARYLGKEGVVTDIDSKGNIGGTWGGIWLLAGIDSYEIVKEG